MRQLRFDKLCYEASEREYWAEDDHRWGRKTTTWFGFWLLAFGSRFRDFLLPNRRQELFEGKPYRPWFTVERTYQFAADNFILILAVAFAAGVAVAQ